MSTRKDMLDDMRATAQALAAHPDCPTLDTYVDERGEPVAVWRCFACEGTEDPQIIDGHSWCPDCGAGDCWIEVATFPGAVRLPNLQHDANAAALLWQLREANVPYLISWMPTSGDIGGHYVTAGDLPHRSEYLAHAVAKAWLAWRGAR